MNAFAYLRRPKLLGVLRLLSETRHGNAVGHLRLLRMS